VKNLHKAGAAEFVSVDAGGWFMTRNGVEMHRRRSSLTAGGNSGGRPIGSAMLAQLRTKRRRLP
jgi:hypothetical protein